MEQDTRPSLGHFNLNPHLSTCSAASSLLAFVLIKWFNKTPADNLNLQTNNRESVERQNKNKGNSFTGRSSILSDRYSDISQPTTLSLRLSRLSSQNFLYHEKFLSSLQQDQFKLVQLFSLQTRQYQLFVWTGAPPVALCSNGVCPGPESGES